MKFRAVVSSVLLPVWLHLAAAPLAMAQAIAPSADDQVRAAELKRAGDVAIDSMRYGEAVDAYTKAYALAKDPALLYNRGRALQALGDFPAALEALEGFEHTASPDLKSRVPKLAELLAEVRSKVATLALTCKVPGARVVLRDKIVGTTPIDKPLRFNAGPANLEITAEGYFPYAKTVELPAGGVLDLEVTLAAKSRSALLVLRGPVPGTVALVDGKVVGNPPVEVMVDAGSHKIVARAEGYADTETSFVVSAGDRKEVELSLGRKPGITSQWWFWTGLGVVVVGGASVAAALLIEKSPSQGDLPPGIVRAPLHF
jgi:PEGA domain